MPSFQDSAVIFFIALLLFGPKKLPELARQLGKLMAEFRRASNEFRMQMDDELRAADQAEQQKKIAEMQAAAPITPLLADTSENSDTTANTIATPPTLTSHAERTDNTDHTDFGEGYSHPAPHVPPPIAAEPLPIATSGALNLMPPSTGLPVGNSTLSPMLDAIPQSPITQSAIEQSKESARANPAPDLTTEAPLHG